MDPVTTSIAAALALGAASGITDATKKAVSDGYESVKALVKRKFGHEKDVIEAIDKLQNNPQSKARQEILAEEIAKTAAVKDSELLAAANGLLEIICALPQGDQHIQQIAHGVGIAQASKKSIATVNVTSPRQNGDV
jgi:disulfide oxidoreductase YuzD